MSVEQMRAAILKVYSGDRWAYKVKRMSDKQVIAVYYRLLNNKQL